MRNWKALSPAAAITLCLIAATARGGSISIPDLGSHLPWMALDGDSRQELPDEDAPALIFMSAPSFEESGGEDGADVEPVRIVSETEHGGPAPTATALDQVPEPASMGMFGIGISGLIMLRRFRKLFS